MDHSSMIKLVGFKTLETCMKTFVLYFLYKLLNGILDCKALLSQINFKICPHNTTSHFLFSNKLYPNFCPNYGSITVISRTILTCNECSNSLIDLDMFRYSYVC